MVQLTTFPTQETLAAYEKATPAYMRPNQVPFAVIAEGLIPPGECLEIASICDQIEEYTHKQCDAHTREVGHIPELDYLRDFAHAINKAFWDYVLDYDTVTWMQTYGVGDSYALHTDGCPGRMRKLTAVTLLTDPNKYNNGDLKMYYHPESLVIPRTQGTVVLFQPWILHQVFPVTRGRRQSLNMSFWGPNFR